MERRLVYICEICGAVLDEHHCKAQCPNCGRMFDCSDLPIMRANGMLDDDEGSFVMAPGEDPLGLAGAEQNGAPPNAQASNPSTKAAPSAEPPPPTTLSLLRPSDGPAKPEPKGNVADLP